MVIGNQGAQEQMHRALETNTSQSFLIVGPAAIGKTFFVRTALEKSFGELDKWGRDIIEVESRDGRSIGINQIKDATSGLNTKGRDNLSVLIEQCHNLTPEAANALLKNLEEPIAGVRFFLTTSDVSAVLSTIKSRCMPIMLRRVGDKEMIKGLIKHGLQGEIEVNRIVSMAQGLPGRAFSLINDKRFRTEESKTDLLVQDWLGGDLAKKMHLAQLIGKDKRSAQELLKKLHQSAEPAMVQHINTSVRRLQNNVQPRTVLEALAMLTS